MEHKEDDKFTKALRYRHLDFWAGINQVVKFFNSPHPWDKAVITELIKGGMTEKEVVQFRDLSLKAAIVFYGKKE